MGHRISKLMGSPVWHPLAASLGVRAWGKEAVRWKQKKINNPFVEWYLIHEEQQQFEAHRERVSLLSVSISFSWFPTSRGRWWRVFKSRVHQVPECLLLTGNAFSFCLCVSYLHNKCQQRCGKKLERRHATMQNRRELKEDGRFLPLIKVFIVNKS